MKPERKFTYTIEVTQTSPKGKPIVTNTDIVATCKAALDNMVARLFGDCTYTIKAVDASPSPSYFEHKRISDKPKPSKGGVPEMSAPKPKAKKFIS